MNYTIIINPHSGNKNTSKAIIRKIKKYLTVPYKIYYTQYAGHGAELAKKAVNKKVDIVIAVGGDGTINEIAGSLVNTSSSLGVIPTGSGNGFARSLCIPLNVKDAIKLLNTPKINYIDVGKINNHYFFGIAGIGFDALVGAKFQNYGKRGALPYFFIGIREYFKYTYETFKIEDSGKIEIHKPLLIAVANTSQYGNGAKIAPQADPGDGFLDLCILYKFNKFQAIKNIISLFNGRINLLPFYSHKKIKSIVINRENSSGYYHVDGEPFFDANNLKIDIIPSALKVCVQKDDANRS